MSSAGTVITVPWEVQMKINNEKRIMKQSLKLLERQNEETMRYLNRQQQRAIKKREQFKQKWKGDSRRYQTAMDRHCQPNPSKASGKAPQVVISSQPEEVQHPEPLPVQAPLSTSARYKMASKDHEIFPRLSPQPKPKPKKLVKVHFNAMLLATSSQVNTKKPNPVRYLPHL